MTMSTTLTSQMKVRIEFITFPDRQTQTHTYSTHNAQVNSAERPLLLFHTKGMIRRSFSLLIDSFDIRQKQFLYLLKIRSAQTTAGVIQKARVTRTVLHRVVSGTNLRNLILQRMLKLELSRQMLITLKQCKYRSAGIHGY